MNKAFQLTVSMQCSFCQTTYTAQGQVHLEHFLSLVAGFLQMTSLSIQVIDSMVQKYGYLQLDFSRHPRLVYALKYTNS